MTEERWVWGVGLATTAEDGTVLDTWFPSPAAGRIPLGYDPQMPPDELDRLAVADERRAVTVEVVAIEADLDAAPTSTPDAYLRLHALSHLLDYVSPAGVRIADASRVRLGAYLSPGTTVMHEGFVNFNAGTLGQSMVEGRISQGVVVGDGSDIGGGDSTAIRPPHSGGGCAGDQRRMALIARFSTRWRCASSSKDATAATPDTS